MAGALVAFDARLAKKRQDEELAKYRPKRDIDYTGPKVKWEDTGLYKAIVRSGSIEDELTQLRNLIRKRTDPSYEPGEDDFNVAPAKPFCAKTDYYNLLQIDHLATTKEVKAAYKRLALQLHPDKNRDKKPEKLREMQEQFEQIQQAYEILSDRATRRQYDRSRYDHARAQSQGMEANMYSQGTDADVNFWGRWAAKRDSAAAGKSGCANRKLPKADDLVVDLWISIDKALRGGLKCREVKRHRIQRSTGGAQGLLKVFYVEVEPGQPDGSARRFPDEGQWPDVHHAPGDLVFRFRHKTHTHLRQVEPASAGDVELAMPLRVRARALDVVLSAWTYTFKGHFVLVRFLNPLPAVAPAKSCTVKLRVDGEGLPKAGNVSRRGAFCVSIEVHLTGLPLVPSVNTAASRDSLMRRFARGFGQQPQLTARLRARSRSAADAVRCYEGQAAVGRGQVASRTHAGLPILLAIWEAPVAMDHVAFAKASASLGFHAVADPSRFCWCSLPSLRPLALQGSAHFPSRPVPLLDEELDLATGREDQGVATDDEQLKFLLRFRLGPPGGFRHLGGLGARASGAGPPSMQRGSQDSPAATHAAVPQEELELTELIRDAESRMEQAKQQWAAKKSRLAVEIKEEETVLRELLDKDREREYARIEREMNGLRTHFENQIQAESRWMSNLEVETAWRNKWVCVFKPAMVKRARPDEKAPIAGRILVNAEVIAKGKPNDDNWLQLDDGHWALTWHPTHGQLLKKFFGSSQSRYEDLEKKIGERRKTRNQTFIDYRRKKKEVSEWTIPPEPTEEERVELQDEEGEQLHNLLAPMLKELRAAKSQLRELRRRRLAVSAEQSEAVERSRLRPQADGGGADGEGLLPPGFEVCTGPLSAAEPADAGAVQPEATSTAAADEPWQQSKALADKACKAADWHTAISAYGKALEAAGNSVGARVRSTLLSNRALARSKVDDWQGCLRDATEATRCDAGWPRGWLRRATAELRLQQAPQALETLQRGVDVAGKLAAQFLPLVTECEAALYECGAAGSGPALASDRIDHLRREGGRHFERAAFGLAVMHYTRALYHRSMMKGQDEATILSNRAAGFLRLELPQEALADATLASEKFPRWAKPLVRAAQAALMLLDFKAAYRHFAKAQRLDPSYPAAVEGVNDCLQRLLQWDYPEATRRWQRFSMDRCRRPGELRIWALSDLFFDQHGVPEWCKSLSGDFFRDDVLMLAGNLADQLPQARFALTVLKSKFRRIFFVPGNHDLWVRRATLQSLLKGERVDNELDGLGDSILKLLELLRVCDELGVDTAPAEVAHGVFVAPMFSWYSRDFMPRDVRRQKAAEPEEGAKVTIDQWVKWPFPGGSDDAWRFFMRMNEAPLRAVLTSKAAYERFAQGSASVITMTHFLTRPDQDLDWTVPGCWDYAGCAGLDEQIRAVGSDLHIYGHACTGPQLRVVDGLPYVHNYVGSTDKHRPLMAPYCVFDRGQVSPQSQPVLPRSVFSRPEPHGKDGTSGDLTQRRFGGG